MKKNFFYFGTLPVLAYHGHLQIGDRLKPVQLKIKKKKKEKFQIIF